VVIKATQHAASSLKGEVGAKEQKIAAALCPSGKEGKATGLCLLPIPDAMYTGEPSTGWGISQYQASSTPPGCSRFLWVSVSI
jgi:uncharacterized protein YcnI